MAKICFRRTGPVRARNALARAVGCLAMLAVAGAAGACTGSRHREPAVTPSARPIADLAARLSDEDLVGQVFLPYAYGSSATGVPPAAVAGNRRYAHVDTPAELIAKYHVAGVILVSRSVDDPTAPTGVTSNVESAAQVRALTDGLQAAAEALPVKAPLLVGTDQEYGVVTRIKDGVTVLPSAMAFGAAADPRLTEAAWHAAGTELAAMGINVDFAPDADVLRASTVIGSRSYGSDPAAVAAQVAAAVRGLRAGGVAATLKHFPGHGHAAGDSHTELPALTQTRQEFERVDLPPFASGVAAGADLVMTGHLDVRAIDPGTPATFSRPVLTDLLRGQLKFSGIAVTDAMDMAPARRRPPGEAAVRALLAGNDLLLQPPNLAAAYSGVLGALRSGRLPRTRLAEAATRVLTLRMRLAGATRPPLSVLRSPEHRAAAAAVAGAAVTQLRGECGVPLSGPITVTAARGREQARGWLVEALREAGAQATEGSSATPSPAPAPAGAAVVVHLVGYHDKPATLRPDATVTVAMDTPDLLARSRSPVLLATYSSSRPAMVALAEVLTGRARPTGASPVPVAGLPRTSCAPGTS